MTDPNAAHDPNAALPPADPLEFAAAGGLTLRRYQQEVARAIVDSVLNRRGLTFAVMFPRQSGKNELQAQLEAYLLAHLAAEDAEIVKISPTWRPQSINALRRLVRVLERNPYTAENWRKENGYILRVGQARIFFLSGAPESNIVGATASTLLEVDEAQDVTLEKFDREIAPMAASTNATRVFWGTAWSTQTLLARELRAAQHGPGGPFPTTFVLTADDVAREVPDYGRFVAGQIAKLGRSHPMVRTQFFSEEIDGQDGMFPPARLALVQGQHAAQNAPSAGRCYAFLLDVAGEDENKTALSPARSAALEESSRRDSTALTIVEVDLRTRADPLLRAPTYRVMARRVWTGERHTALYGQMRALIDAWQPRHVVVDATGVGAGLASFLSNAYTKSVIPFIFSSASKSQLGWDFLAVVDSGRWQEPADPQTAESALFLRQLTYTQAEVLPGPGRLMRWGVPDGSRDPQSGAYLHDDLVISAALSAVLDRQPWPAPLAAQPAIIRAKDPLDEMKGF
jgi:hypothetical protein